MSISRTKAAHPRLVYALGWLVVTACIVLIATVFKHHAFVRGHVIDIFAVPFVAFFLLLFYPFSARGVALLSWLIALAVEVSQYFKLADVLGLERGSFLHQFLGSTFSVGDMLMYSIGAILTYGVLLVINKKATQ